MPSLEYVLSTTTKPKLHECLISRITTINAHSFFFRVAISNFFHRHRLPIRVKYLQKDKDMVFALANPAQAQTDSSHLEINSK